MGPDYRGYRDELSREISRLGISDSTMLLDPVVGTLKYSLYASADIFVLPSKSEAFSMSLLESSAVGLPAIYSKQCHFPELAKNNGGWEIERSEDALANQLEKLLNLPKLKLKEQGLNAKKWAAANFSSEVIADKLIDLYKKVIYENSKL